jgi:hypothetical protein
VGILKKIRGKLRNYFFHREVNRRSRRKMVMGLDESRVMGIIFDASESTSYSQVASLVTSLRESGKKVRAIGFVRQKHKPDYLVDQIHFSFCQSADFTWNLKLKTPSLVEFTDTETDLLLDLSPSGLFYPKYLAALCNARYKVGNYHPDQVEIYDLMIREKEPFELQEFIDHCLQYLRIIKKPVKHA